jgi:hypothetical protein
MIEDGAYFKGSIEIDRSASTSDSDLDKPSYTRAATVTAATTQAHVPTTKSSS